MTIDNVLNLGHNKVQKKAEFHPKALDFIRSQSTAIRQQLGEAIRDLQKGMALSMPLSRPMPSVAPGVAELRVKDDARAVRVFYITKVAGAVLIFHGFEKTTQQTPKREIDLGRKRLKEVVHGKK